MSNKTKNKDGAFGRRKPSVPPAYWLKRRRDRLK